MEHKLTQEKNIYWLAQLRGGKGKVTREFVMKGLAQLLIIEKVNLIRKENNISDEQVRDALKHFTHLFQ